MKDLFGLGKLGKNTTEVIKLIYPDLAQPGLKKVGDALATVLDLSNTILLPIKLLNENGKVYFQKHMDDYKEKLNKVDQEQIGTVVPEVGLVILDELLKVTNDDLANLFTNLLVNASTIDHSRNAHPSFINVIKSLSADEAKIINYLSDSQEYIVYIQFYREDEDGSSIPLENIYNNLNYLVELDYEDNAEFYINNLINLGIIKSREVYYNRDIDKYEKLEKKYKSVIDDFENTILNLPSEHHLKNSRISIARATYPLTDFGKKFIESISLRNQ